MRFCTICSSAMRRDTTSGEVVFRCPACNAEQKGGPSDAVILNTSLKTGEVIGMYDRLIMGAPFDRTITHVRRDCPGCGIDYMAQLLVGAEMVVVYRCQCGYNSGA